MRALKDPTSVVLVAEDVLLEHEDDTVYAALKNAASYSPATGRAGSKVVVGVASVGFKPGSPYQGMFQPLCEPIVMSVLDFGLRLTRIRFPGWTGISLDSCQP